LGWYFVSFDCHCQEEVVDSWIKGRVLYENDLSRPEFMEGWIMEGPGKTEFKEGWMHMYSPDEEWHHVYWCSVDFPESFVAEWEMQNMNPDAGLCIIFFATKGINGEDIFDPVLPEREGTFKYYTKGMLNSYHISYYANNPKNQEREASHLRKNNMFAIMQMGSEGIARHSTAIHHVRLVKNGARIAMSIDGKKIIDWTDDGKIYGPVYGGGKIGFRQMQWSYFRYRDFKLWEIGDTGQ
jgi:hypothetical protein